MPTSMLVVSNHLSRAGAIAAPCPLCQAPLSAEHPEECDRCDWIARRTPDATIQADNFRDRVAVILSVIPGLGHLYKGYTWQAGLCAAGALLAFPACAVAATFTAGFGLLLLPLYWVGIMLHVYWIEDRGQSSLAN